MLDNLDPRESGNRPGHQKFREAPATRPAPDREVPLTGRRTPAAVQAWLDGDLPEAAVRDGDMERHVDFWRHVEREAHARRQMRTPVHVYRQIMDALPQTTPSVITPWWRRPREVTPITALAVTAGLLGAGMLLGATVLHLR